MREMDVSHLQRMVRPGRRIKGISAVLLPFRLGGEPDLDGLRRLLERTFSAGLTPAVNMDTGHVDRLDPTGRREVLECALGVSAGRPFVAGTFVRDEKGAAFRADAYLESVAEVQSFGGTPIVFQSHGLTALDDEGLVRAYESIAREADAFYAFELGTMFAPFGRIYDLSVYEALMRIPSCRGAKHSSLSRALEWERLQLRDRVRPAFHVFTGNDLAIDMVVYGSDYLLGLSAFAPEHFALRDRFWADGDLRFYELNDLLQYLGFVAFRAPVPAYKHSAAQFLQLRGRIESSQTHRDAPKRPASDVAILGDIASRLAAWEVS